MDAQEDTILATGLSLKEISKIIHDNPGKKVIRERLKAVGEAYLKRYDIWEKYVENFYHKGKKESFVVLISGVPGTGKTTLAAEIATRLGIKTVMCGDWMREIIRPLISKDQYPSLFVPVYEAWKQFSQEPKDDAVIKGYLSQAEPINSGVRYLLERSEKKGEVAVIEYLHFMPIPELKSKGVIPMLMVLKDEDIHAERIRAREQTTHFKESADRLIDNLDKYRVMQDWMIDQAKKNGVQIIEETNYQKKVEKVLDVVLARIDKLTA